LIYIYIDFSNHDLFIDFVIIFMYLSVDYAIHFSGKPKINKRNKYRGIFFDSYGFTTVAFY